MPYYSTLGQIPPKRHIQFRRPDGALYSEEVFGTEGFVGPTSTIYHIHPPTQVTGWKSLYSTKAEYVETDTMRMRHLKSAPMPRKGDPITGRVVLFGNADCEMSVCCPAEPMDYHFKNGQGDECLFIHFGSGTCHTQFGTLTFRRKDYILIPKGTIYKLVFDEQPADEPPVKFLVIETCNHSHIGPPPRYVSKTTSQFLEHAPYCERDLRGPELPLTFDEAGSNSRCGSRPATACTPTPTTTIRSTWSAGTDATTRTASTSTISVRSPASTTCRLRPTRRLKRTTS